MGQEGPGWECGGAVAMVGIVTLDGSIVTGRDGEPAPGGGGLHRLTGGRYPLRSRRSRK